MAYTQTIIKLYSYNLYIFLRIWTYKMANLSLYILCLHKGQCFDSLKNRIFLVKIQRLKVKVTSAYKSYIRKSILQSKLKKKKLKIKLFF